MKRLSACALFLGISTVFLPALAADSVSARGFRPWPHTATGLAYSLSTDLLYNSEASSKTVIADFSFNAFPGSTTLTVYGRSNGGGSTMQCTFYRMNLSTNSRTSQSKSTTSSTIVPLTVTFSSGGGDPTAHSVSCTLPGISGSAAGVYGGTIQ